MKRKIPPCKGGPEAKTPEEEALREIACQRYGCHGCEYYDGTEYYLESIKESVAKFAKRYLEEMAQ